MTRKKYGDKGKGTRVGDSTAPEGPHAALRQNTQPLVRQLSWLRSNVLVLVWLLLKALKACSSPDW